MKEDIREGFIRQRRNLIIITTIVFFLEFTQISLNSINLLGNDLTISEPDFVNTVFWIAMCYWLIRYIQYFYGLENNEIKNTFIYFMEKEVPKGAFKIYLKKEDLFPDDKEKPKVKIVDVGYVIRKSNIWIVQVNYFDSLKNKTLGSGQLTVQDWDLTKAKIRSWIYSMFVTRNFTEYFLPLVMAALVIMYKVTLVMFDFIPILLNGN